MVNLYKYTRYRGYSVFIEHHYLTFHAEVWHNGSIVFDSISAFTGKGCLAVCKDLIDKELRNA